jgi:hypothetical protein
VHALLADASARRACATTGVALARTMRADAVVQDLLDAYRSVLGAKRAEP